MVADTDLNRAPPPPHKVNVTITADESMALCRLLGHIKQVAQRRQGDRVGVEAAKRHAALERVLNWRDMPHSIYELPELVEAAMGDKPGTILRLTTASADYEVRRLAKPDLSMEAAVTGGDPNKELRDAGYDVITAEFGGYPVWKVTMPGGWALGCFPERVAAWAAARQHHTERMANAAERASPKSYAPDGYGIRKSAYGDWWLASHGVNTIGGFRTMDDAFAATWAHKEGRPVLNRI